MSEEEVKTNPGTPGEPQNTGAGASASAPGSPLQETSRVNSTKTPDSTPPPEKLKPPSSGETSKTSGKKKGKKSNKEDSTELPTKEKAKQEILDLIVGGKTYAQASAIVREKYHYHRSTPHTWLKDVDFKDEGGQLITFKERVLNAEHTRLGNYEKGQMDAALGGKLIGYSHRSKVKRKFRPDGSIESEEIDKSESKTWSTPSSSAASKGISHATSRLRKIATEDKESPTEELEKVSKVDVMVEDDGTEAPAPVARVEVMVKHVRDSEGKPDVDIEVKNG